MMYRAIFYFFLLCSSLFVNANPTYFAHERFEKFGIQDGLSSSKVFDIKQDKDGYIWCATDEGFCRFDGIAFKITGGLLKTPWILQTNRPLKYIVMKTVSISVQISGY